MLSSATRNRLGNRNIKPTAMIGPPSRRALRAASPVLFRSGRNWSKADILLWEEAGVRLAVKDYSPRPPWIRDTLGRLLVSRECAAYARLKGIPGIPPLSGRVDAYAFALGFVEGRELSTLRRGEVPAAFFDRLMDLLAAVHRAGVAHGDLHHRDVLHDRWGFPWLVDFSTSVLAGPRPGGIRRRLFEAACLADRRAALKLKRRHAPHAISEEEARDLDCPPTWYRVGKRLRGLIRR